MNDDTKATYRDVIKVARMRTWGMMGDASKIMGLCSEERSMNAYSVRQMATLAEEIEDMCVNLMEDIEREDIVAAKRDAQVINLQIGMVRYFLDVVEMRRK